MPKLTALGVTVASMQCRRLGGIGGDALFYAFFIF